MAISSTEYLALRNKVRTQNHLIEALIENNKQLREENRKQNERLLAYPKLRNLALEYKMSVDEILELLRKSKL